jgi:tRNA A-37 threonylcarbamoyl transferase component Bud32
MPQQRRTAASLEGGRAEHDLVLDRFEAAWQRGTPPVIAGFLPVSDAPRRDLLLELVKIDLEYRWRRDDGRAARNGPFLEAYIDQLPELGRLSRLDIDLIGEEYRVRQRWGDQPGHDEYARRFPRQGPRLGAFLKQIDDELKSELATPDLRAGRRRSDRVDRSLLRKRPAPRCPHCRQAFDFPAELKPQEFACPACGGTFSVESLSTSSELTVEPPFARLGRYELGDLLGMGAFGSVWRARDVELARDVALKLPRRGQLMGPEQEERFLREARSAARLQHAGIVAIHDVGRDQNTLFIVSELVQGVTLAEWLQHHRPGFGEIAELAAHIADALEFAHQRGVVHRDVKPSNITLQASAAPNVECDSQHSQFDIHHSTLATPFVPRLMDFGLALRNAAEITMTLDGQVLGTPAYMSPEQLRNLHAVDGRSDL